MSPTDPLLTIHTLPGPALTPHHLTTAAALFSSHYGIWSPSAPLHHPSRCPSSRIRMSATYLASALLPSSHLDRCVLVRALTAEGEVVGHAFACSWDVKLSNPAEEGEVTVCWVTQLVVHSSYRGRGVAKRMLSALKTVPEAEGEGKRVYGILSSHPFACMALIRAFGSVEPGLDRGDCVDLEFMRRCAADVMAASPVPYVRDAKLCGSLFEENVSDGAVSCADTAFHVDHAEPLEALEALEERDIQWPLGNLREGCEFLVLFKSVTA